MASFLRRLSFATAVGAMLVTMAIGVPAVALAQAAAPPASSAPSAATVKALQEALNKQGIAIEADGLLDEETRIAIRRYQTEHHLPVTGEPDEATLGKLGVPGQRGESSPVDASGSAAARPSTGAVGSGMKGPDMMGSGGTGPGMMGSEMMKGKGAAPGTR